MSEQQKQRNSGKIIEAIIEKLLPWHRIKWLSVGQLSQTVRIRVVGMNVAVGLCPDESLFQVQSLEPATSPEDLHQIQRLEAILNGAKRDDAGNLTSMVCVVDKGIEKPSYSVSAVVPLLPDPGEGYRLLDKSEELKPGDEYWSAEDRKWKPSLRAIYYLNIRSGSDVYRRKIETLEPKQLAIPEGWRELERSETPKASDMVEHGSSWIARSGDSSVEYEWYGVRIIRKIETANPSEAPNSSTWIPKVGDRVRVNKPGRIAHGKIGVVAEEDAGEYAVRIVGEDLKSFNLKAEHLELIEAKPTKWTPKIGDIVRINSPGQINHGKVGIVVDKRARRYDVASEVSGKWKAWGLTANELEFKGSQK